MKKGDDKARAAVANEDPSAALIDLREIPADAAKGDQDQFELFARDFLHAIGFRIVQGPGRGIDRGRDLIVEEELDGIGGTFTRKWLVSAKHYAGSRKSVNDADESDPMGRVRKFKCDGFMPFYSTIPASGLDDTLDKLRQEFQVCRFDRGRISIELLSRPKLAEVFRQYLPKSYERWLLQGRRPVRVFGKGVTDLPCMACGKNLLLDNHSIFVYVQNIEKQPNEYVDLYWACKGTCDATMERQTKHSGITLWDDLQNLRVPQLYIREWATVLTQVSEGQVKFSEKALAKFVELMAAISQVVARETTEDQWNTAATARQLAEMLG